MEDLLAMGFNQIEAENALNSSGGNLEAAIDILTSEPNVKLFYPSCFAPWLINPIYLKYYYS